MEVATLVIAISALFFAATTAITGVYALILVKALEKSTHSVQYVPVDQDFAKESEKQVEKINKEFQEYVEDDYSDIIEPAY